MQTRDRSPWARLGEYWFFACDPERALRVWAAAADSYDADEIIAEMCDLIGEHESTQIDVAISLTDLIRDRTMRAKTLASLSEYV
jgi:hypothetical protein